MRLDELDKRIDSIAKQVKAIRSTQDKKSPVSSKPVAKPASKPVSPAKQELNWRLQKSTEWTHGDGTKMISSRGLPAGWINDAEQFVPLKYNSWSLDELRKQLMKHRYDTPLFR